VIDLGEEEGRMTSRGEGKTITVMGRGLSLKAHQVKVE
jgi:hypothetical protein